LTGGPTGKKKIDRSDLTRSTRFVVFGVAAFVSLVSADTALAAYDPELLVVQTNRGLGGGTNVVVDLNFTDGHVDDADATGATTIYSPRGYGVKLGHPAGTRLGYLSALVWNASTRTHESVDGSVATDDPANHLTNSCAPGRHDAVWLLDFPAAGTRFRVPVYVDRLSVGPEAAYASARMLFCLASPYVPPPQGSPAGARVRLAFFLLTDVFANPRRAGTYAWNAVFTPYTRGTATPNPSLAVQSTTHVRLPLQFTITAQRLRRGGRSFALVRACVRAAGQPLRGIRVSLAYGGATIFRSRQVRNPRTSARGCFITRIPIGKRPVLFASFGVPIRHAAGCAPTLAPRCSRASVVAPVGRFYAVRIRR
jgi:hypothetical protein